MSNLVVLDRQLWLNLVEIKDALGDGSSVQAGPVLLTQHLPKKTTAVIADQHTRNSTSPPLITTSVSSLPPRGDLPLEVLRPLAEDRRSVAIDLQKEASHERCLQLRLWNTVQGHTGIRLLAQLAYHLPRDIGGF